MQDLIATKSFSYGGKRHDVGGPLQARPRDARLLVALGKAQVAPAADAEDKKPAKAEPKAKGSYLRRDMKAD